MRALVRRGLCVIGIAGGITLLGAGIAASTATADEGGAGLGSVASANSSDTTSGDDGAGSGNQTDTGGTAPVDASGNQVTVIGDGNRSDGSQSDGSDTVDPDAPSTPGAPGQGFDPSTQGDTGNATDPGRGGGTSDASSTEAALAVLGGGGPGMPAATQNSASAPTTAVLPQTGTDAGLAMLMLAGLLLLLAGGALTMSNTGRAARSTTR